MPLFLWILFKDKKNALILFFLAFSSLLIADWSSNILKHYFERIRPCHELDVIRVLVGCGKSFSMPSNHAANAFAFAMPFYVLLKNRLRYAFVAGAILIGFSRIYVGVHYPSDVIVGAVVGLILAITVVCLYKWLSKRYKEKPYTTVLFVFLLSLSLFRIYYILNGPLDLSPDEAHYWEWSRRLDLSYYSKGPMIAYLIFLGTSVFGDTVFGIRIMAVVLSALSSIILYILGKKLYDEKVGLSAAILLQLIPLFSTYGIVFTIDSPFIFFWVLSLYFFWKAINAGIRMQDAGYRIQDNKNHSSCIVNHDSVPNTHHSSLIYWYLLALSTGLGLLTKYTMAFFYPCAFLSLLLSGEYRKILLTKWPYLSFIISLIVFSPLIIWNINNDWVTLRHTAGQAHVAEGIQISLKTFFEFLGSQIGVITPVLLIIMIFSIFKLRKDRKGYLLFWFSVPVIAFFLLKSLQAKVQANWALPGYIAGIVAFTAFCTGKIHSGRKGMKVLIGSAVLISVIVTATGHYPSLLRLPVKLDPTMRLQGWKEIGAEVTEIYEQMSSAHPVFIFSDRYQVSSELAFYVKGHPVTYCINLGRRMNQYDLWPGFDDLLHYNAIYVSLEDSKMPEEVSAAFDKVEKRLFSAYTKKHVKIRDYSIFTCYNFKGLKMQLPETY
ncbi:MAG: glycosyltransferase family 39 protein [Nitrospirae bacterium]|nr:glycosyltransferase family 39 protein [Nitrospirota bacterium]